MEQDWVDMRGQRVMGEGQPLPGPMLRALLSPWGMRLQGTHQTVRLRVEGTGDEAALVLATVLVAEGAWPEEHVEIERWLASGRTALQDAVEAGEAWANGARQ